MHTTQHAYIYIYIHIHIHTHIYIYITKHTGYNKNVTPLTISIIVKSIMVKGKGGIGGVIVEEVVTS